MVKINPSLFKWSSDEQVYPYELASDGSTLYCKEVSMGSLPSNGTLNVSHNISGLDVTADLHFLSIVRYGDRASQMPYGCWSGNSYDHIVDVTDTQVRCTTTQNMTSYTAIARIIYKK